MNLLVAVIFILCIIETIFPANEIMGQLDDFVDNPDIVFAPIDILLYHLKELEYLHKDYNEIEKFQR